ncbi:DNA mismatch repair protein MutS [Muricauda sp. 2012CJ35-5]|uniref:DNA mismatch repair protein MutS n=1 Tax=Flagellimonas spongiicola TaxID=2942208 RepID=A0ABT0PN43_9FLAO|nr:Smr/MutS family protein [Allomuricauda spongiicola]MCL6272793.1 DNA mismatch repair protein MutS [Allomuricauda spongiicola]
MSNTKFKIGDKVEVLDENITGYVDDLVGETVIVITEDGFPLSYQADELLLKKEGIKVSNYEASMVKKEKDRPSKKRTSTPKPKQRNAPKMEVDLHVHQLIKSTRGMSKFDIVNLQLDTAKRQLEFAIQRRIQKIVFIHGVGEGILKEELGYLFRKYEGIDWYDADYQKYGMGATEVYICQSANS